MDKYYKYRVFAYVTFFTGLLVFWGGLLVSMYHVSAVGAAVSVAVGSLLLLATLFLGGKGWSVFQQPERRLIFEEEHNEITGTHLVRGYGAMNPEEPPLHDHPGPVTIDEEAGYIPLEDRRGTRGYGARNPEEAPFTEPTAARYPEEQSNPPGAPPE